MEYAGDDWSVVSGPVTADIYSGACGIALFLARLYELTPNPLYRTTAEGALEYTIFRLSDLEPGAHNGFYGGWAGIAYVLTELGTTLNNERFVEEALQFLQEMAADDPARHPLDLIFGSAGAAVALLGIFRRYPQQEILDLAFKYGEHLIATANKTELGWSWKTLGNESSKDILGFSHGVAGIAWALLELANATRDQRFREGAEEAFRYERHWFSAEHENWPDLRDHVGPDELFPVAWCHGAPGIGLSRLRAYELTGQDVYRLEAQAALRTTVKSLSRKNQSYSICHGVAGNADLLIWASQVLGDLSVRHSAEEKGMEGIALYGDGKTQWPWGTYWGGPTPGLMQGLSGIGYFYLRLADPLKVPPVTIVYS